MDGVPYESGSQVLSRDIPWIVPGFLPRSNAASYRVNELKECAVLGKKVVQPICIGRVSFMVCSLNPVSNLLCHQV